MECFAEFEKNKCNQFNVSSALHLTPSQRKVTTSSVSIRGSQKGCLCNTFSIIFGTTGKIKIRNFKVQFSTEFISLILFSSSLLADGLVVSAIATAVSFSMPCGKV